MKSSTAKYRTASTAVQSRPKLPKIATNLHREAASPINKKLFGENHSLLLHQTPSSNKLTYRERIKTEISTERGPYQSRHQRVEDMGRRRLQEQLQRVEGMFRQIQTLRQSYGIVSLNEKGEEEERVAGEFQQVPYDPHLYEMNEQILQIKSQIEESLEEVFRICRQFPRLKQLIEHLLEQQMAEFLVENVRTGKIAAMKAQHRLMVASRERVGKMCKF